MAHDGIPDVRDGLTRVERVILWELHEVQKEFPGRRVPTATLYGRVVEHVSLSVEDFQRILARLTGRGWSRLSARSGSGSVTDTG